MPQDPRAGGPPPWAPQNMAATLEDIALHHVVDTVESRAPPLTPIEVPKGSDDGTSDWGGGGEGAVFGICGEDIVNPWLCRAKWGNYVCTIFIDPDFFCALNHAPAF